MIIKGKRVELKQYTREDCHDFFKTYLPDSSMTYDEYSYNKNGVDSYYDSKVLNSTRRFFGIVVDDTIIGEIQIKYIDEIEKCGTLSIVIGTDEYKNKGYGSEAIRLILGYAKDELKLNTIFADAVHRNERSKHVLESIGFTYIKDDDVLRYYEYIL